MHRLAVGKCQRGGGGGRGGSSDGKRSVKRQKRQKYAKAQRKRENGALQRSLQKLVTTQLRLLTATLKKAKGFELAKAARKVKAASQAGRSIDGLVARQATLKVRARAHWGLILGSIDSCRCLCADRLSQCPNCWTQP